MATIASVRLADEHTSSHSSEIRRLGTFLEISQTLAAASNHKSVLQQALAILAAMGLALYFAVDRAVRRAVPWQAEGDPNEEG